MADFSFITHFQRYEVRLHLTVISLPGDWLRPDIAFNFNVILPSTPATPPYGRNGIALSLLND
ncbi:hypothetical protein [Dyadobacter soli]|uniref:hypothetical protein n=1 Tax=Dyadobacter soli TaxID=659014 RepID=UPI00115F8AD5|nr:hypothetical protein [Dyadobacter soli]